MAEPLTLHEALIDIQQRLKVPKDKRNEYSPSKFMYRNLEAIEEAVKPMLKEHELTLTFFDDVIAVGTRVFVKATAELQNKDGTTISVSAFAQHATEKKGMDDAQLTGSCSSYARKYAAGGLFLIDETKDADSMDNNQKPKEVRDRVAESKAGAEPMGKPLSILDQAKLDIGEELKRQGYNRPDTMLSFINNIIGKDSIDTIDEATLVANALDDQENETDNGVDYSPDVSEDGNR